MENLVSLHDLPAIFKDKKVFVTGHTGFKGAWLCAWLHSMGATIAGYSLAPEYENGLYSLLKPMNLFEDTIADIRDKPKLSEAITAFQPDYVFHLAAQPLVRRSYQIPAETFDVNVTGTAIVLEVVKNLPNKCTVVVVTTDKVYENKEDGSLFKEDDVLAGHDPYSASKAATEIVVKSFQRSFFHPQQDAASRKSLASARAGNVIGGGDWSSDRIMPDIVRSLLTSQVIEVRNPSAVRPWQHVLEPLAGYLQLAAMLHNHPEKYSQAYNFGPLPKDHLEVKDFVQEAIQCWGNGAWKDVSEPGQLHEAGVLKLDISKAKNELGWVPKLSADEAIQWTIDWYKADSSKQVNCTFQQIEKYQSL